VINLQQEKPKSIHKITSTTALTTNFGRSPSNLYVVAATSIGVICHAGTIALAVPNRIARTSGSDALLVVIAWINLINTLFYLIFYFFHNNFVLLQGITISSNNVL